MLSGLSFRVVVVKAAGCPRKTRIRDQVLTFNVNGGRQCIPRMIYPGENDLGIEPFADGGTARLKSVDVWEMKSIW